MEALKEKAAQIIEKIKTFAAKFSKKTKMIFGASALALILVGIGVWWLLANKPYETIFTGLSQQEVTEVAARLTDLSVDFKIEEGNNVQVAPQQASQVMAQMVSEGYPKSGFTYDVFTDNISLMSTDTEKTYYMTKQLEQKMAATICLFEGVKEATVQLTIGNEKKYILDQNRQEPSASVVVLMHNQGSPTQEQVKGIQRLVSSAVLGLTTENVSIIDGTGKDVSQMADKSSSNTQYDATTLKMQIEREVEEETKAKILHILAPIFGENNIRIAVKSVVDIDKKIKEIINYIPSQDNKGVISKENLYQESTNATKEEGGVPGSESNAEVPVYPGVSTDGNRLIFTDDRSYEYLVSQVTEQIQSDAATYLQTSVAITIGTKELNMATQANLKKLVANAAGISPEFAQQQIEIFAMPFDTVIPTGGGSIQPNTMPWEMIFIISSVVLILLLILSLLLRRRKKIKQAKEAITQDSNVQPNDLLLELEEIRKRNQESAQTIEAFKLSDVMDTKVTKLQEEITNFAQNNPTIVAQIIKTWLRGEDEDNG